ncbi:hypothetical protein ACFL6S_00785 [Candidatus Poribacteria bacterium]
MLTLDKLTIDFPCPLCGFYNAIFFKQARLRDLIICRGCKANIQLDDQMNECRKAERSFRRSIRELQKAIKDVNITIELG